MEKTINMESQQLQKGARVFMEVNYKKDNSLKHIIGILVKRLWIIILCTVIGTAGTFLISTYIIDKEYTSSVSMYVTPNIDNPTAGESLNYLYYAQQIVGTYAHVLKTTSFLKSISDATKLGYNAEQLEKMIEVEVVDETEILKISVTSNSPGDSYELASTAAILAPKKILEMKTANSVSVVDEAVIPVEASKPNILINTIIGFVLGLGFGYLIVNILELFDNRIKDEDDFLRNYELPILGIIPKIKKEEGGQNL